MKRSAIAIFTGAILLLLTQLDISDEKRYLNHISNIYSGKQLDGPEKGIFRDVLMTMNPKNGLVEAEKTRAFFRGSKRSRSNQRNFAWEQVDTEIAGRVRAIAIDPNNNNKLWAGSVTGGLWYNPDFRNNDDWVSVSDDWESLSIDCIKFDPNDSQTIYVGTGESYTSVNIYRESSSSGAGIYKSTDGGNSWTLLTSTLNFDYVNDIEIRTEEGNSVVYAGVASGIYQGNVFGSSPSDGLYRSLDNGVSWQQVLPNMEGESVPYTVSDIEISGDGSLYVGTMRNLEQVGGGRILSSSNGTTWKLEDDFYAEDIIVDGLNYGLNLIPGRVKLSAGENTVYAALTAGWLNNFSQIRDSGFFTRLMVKRDGVWEYVDAPSTNWASIPWHALAITPDPNDENRLVIGGLDFYALPDATSTGGLSWIRSSNWASMYHFSDYTRNLFYGGIDQDFSDSLLTHFVHADIHSIVFGNTSDEVVIATDGGVNYSSDLTKNFELLQGERLDEYASFGHINNSFATTQYYTVALHPEAGNNEVLAGSQDNSTHTTEGGAITYSKMIGGGDGAYCFFDSDDLNLRITSSQVGNYNFWVEGDDEYFYGVGGGTFINPADYDDRSNLIYSNLAVDGGFEALSTSLEGRYLDSLAILNVNKFLKKDDLGLDTLTYVRLGTNSATSFSSIKVSPHDNELDATIFLGNQVGDVFRIEGLPYNPRPTKIDSDEIPVGYISSIDVGDSNDDVLVTLSNYGVESVWYTSNGGSTWQNLERNLPDVPVRHGIFNPLDDQKILLATEVGVWGLENIPDKSAEWVSYNDGLPNVRVDMIAARGEDSVIVAATHGRGLFLGKFNQGELLENPLSVASSESALHLYPNPTTSFVRFSQEVKGFSVYAIDGTKLYSSEKESQGFNISSYPEGIYIFKTQEESGKEISFRIIKE